MTHDKPDVRTAPATATGRMILTIAPAERRLALMNLWGVLGAFGGSLILVGLTENEPLAGAAGTALLIVGYFVHIFVNWAGGFRGRQAFVSFRWFWALIGAFLVLINALWLFG